MISPDLVDQLPHFADLHRIGATRNFVMTFGDCFPTEDYRMFHGVSVSQPTESKGNPTLGHQFRALRDDCVHPHEKAENQMDNAR